MSGAARNPKLHRVGGDAFLRAPLWQQILICIGTAGLSWFAAEISFHTPSLSALRLALNFCIVVSTVILWGRWPSLLALAVSAAAYHYYYPPIHSFPFWSPDRLIPTSVILLVGILIIVLIWRSQGSDRDLRTAITELQERSNALIQAQQASRSAAWTSNIVTGEIRWYEGGANVFGRPNLEIPDSHTAHSLILEEDRAKVMEAEERTFRTGKPFDVEFRVLWPNGELHWLETRGTPLPGRPSLWHGATVDVTERKRAEQTLMRTEKLAVAGRLAASIAHEINNPLEAVTNLCYLARVTASNPETERYVKMAEEELRRVAQITSQTLRFHRQQSAPEPTDMVELARSVLSLYEQKLAHARIAVHFEAQPTELLLCYAGEIRQVFANLVGNAIDAMEAGGVLTVRIRTGTYWPTEGTAVRITVGDSGHGMDPEVRKHLYEPFYTTKADVGTGLGLWVSATLVEKHRGHMAVYSSTGQAHHGTVFSVVLPYEGTGVAAVKSESARPAAVASPVG